MLYKRRPVRAEYASGATGGGSVGVPSTSPSLSRYLCSYLSASSCIEQKEAAGFPDEEKNRMNKSEKRAQTFLYMCMCC